MFLLGEKPTLQSVNMLLGFYSSAQQLDTLRIHRDIPAGEASLERLGCVNDSFHCTHSLMPLH